MQKISALLKTQAQYMFNQKKQQAIHNTLKKIADEKGISFEEVLNIYRN